MLKYFLKNKPTLLTSNRLFSFLIVTTVQLVVLSCNSDSSNQSQSETINNTPELYETNNQKLEVVIDIKEITSGTLSEVEKLLGKAESQEKVKGYPCKNSDCIRAYFQGGKYEVIFKAGKADRITINEVPNLTASDNAIQVLGLSQEAPSFTNPNTVARWNSIQGFHEISFFTDYILVQVTQPE